MPTPPLPSTPATRLPASRWRDPRLLLGTAIVAGSVLLGSWVVATTDDTEVVWGVRGALPAGSRIGADDLEPRRVRFADGHADRYLRTVVSLVGKSVSRGVGAGELLPAAAVAGTAGPGGVQLPITVESGALPNATGPGSVVDVWVVPRDPVPGGTQARRVLKEVAVIEVPRSADPLAPATSSTLLVAVPEIDDVAGVLGASADGRLVVTLRGAR